MDEGSYLYVYDLVIPRKAGKGVSAREAYKINGNAVQCVLAYNIANNIQDKWRMYFKER